MHSNVVGTEKSIVKILYVTQYLSSVGGGGEVVFCELARGISQNGHRVYVISQRVSESVQNNNISFESKHNPHICRINPLVRSSPPSIRQNMIFIFNAILKGSKIVRDHKIDLIHVNNYSPIIVGNVLSTLFKIPLISTIHTVLSAASPDFWKIWSSQKNISIMSSILGPMLENLTIKIPVNTIHTVSNATRKDILKVNSRSKVVVIPNGIDLSPYDKSIQHSTIDYQKYVVFIGRLVFNKNLDTIISAFVQVRNKIPDAKLVVIGFGPMMEKWKEMVIQLGLTENVHFTGYISHEYEFERKTNILSKSSALLLPSIKEGMPLVALEAFALHKAALLSDIEPHHDIVDHGLNGFLIPTYDIGEWADKIILILSNRSMCEEMGKKARAKVENQFTYSRVIKEIESLYVYHL